LHLHFYRNVFSHVSAGKLREVAVMLKAVHAQEDLAAAQRKAAEVVARLHSMRLGKAAELVETAVPETLAYYAFPEEHWRRIRTNDPLERIMREIRRRTRVVGAFSDGNSANRRHALVHQAISEHGAAQAAQRHVRLTTAGYRPKVRKILDTTDQYLPGVHYILIPKFSTNPLWRKNTRSRSIARRASQRTSGRKI
jgi:transposase-like protein